MSKRNTGELLSDYEQTVYKTLTSVVVELSALEQVLINKNLITADDLRNAAEAQDLTEKINAAAVAADLACGVSVGAPC